MSIGQSCWVCSNRSFFPFELAAKSSTSFVSSLATDTEYVRSRLAEYANDLLSLGVDGLRLDAAKSEEWSLYNMDDALKSLVDIAASDISNITSRLTSSPYITQEVIYGAGEAVQPSEYVNIGESPRILWSINSQSIRSGDVQEWATHRYPEIV